MPGDRLLGVHVEVAQRGGRRRTPRVELGCQRSQLGYGRATGIDVADEGTIDHHDGSARQERWQVVERWEVDDAKRRGHLVGRAPGPRVPRMEDVEVTFVGPQEHARVDLAIAEERELQRGHHAEVASATAQRPEQVGVFRRRCPRELAVGGDDFDRRHLVRGEAVLARQPTQAAAERVPDDADVGRGP